MSSQGAAAIMKTMREVRNIFTNICILLMFQSLKLIAIVIQNAANQDWGYRLFDVMDTILMISYISMCFGFSVSVKKAFNAQLKKKKKLRKRGSINEK